MNKMTREPLPAPGEAEIRRWLCERLEKELDLTPQSIDVKKPLSRFGLDSMVGVCLSADLEDWLGRSVPPTIFAESPCIAALARRLAGERADGESGATIPSDFPDMNAGAQPDAGAWDTRTWSPIQRRIRRTLRFLVRVLCRLDMDESVRLPDSGPFILAANHLHVLDTPILFALITRPASFFVSSHMKRFPIARWFLSRVAHTIWVSRGEWDIAAIQAALGVLRAGGVLIVAPEGLISRGGGLLKGRTGAAYLASAAGVPVVPIAGWGQENALRCWVRLRRVLVAIRIGQPLYLPSGKATARELEERTETIMLALARLLPPEYRGHYRGRTDTT